MMVMIETLNNHQDLLLPVFHNLHYYRHQVARRILLKEKTKIQSKCQSKKDKSIFFSQNHNLWNKMHLIIIRSCIIMIPSIGNQNQKK